MGRRYPVAALKDGLYNKRRNQCDVVTIRIPNKNSISL